MQMTVMMIMTTMMWVLACFYRKALWFMAVREMQ